MLLALGIQRVATQATPGHKGQVGAGLAGLQQVLPFARDEWAQVGLGIRKALIGKRHVRLQVCPQKVITSWRIQTLKVVKAMGLPPC